MRKRIGAAVLGLLLVAMVGAGLPAGAQAPITSDNVRLLTTLPDTLAISAEFARTGDLFYVSTIKSISAYDISDPRSPQLLGTYANLLFENESMTYGERMINGELRRFVILGNDIVGDVPITQPEHFHIGSDHFHILDVTDPTDMKIVGESDTETSTHTVQCLDQADCMYAYTAGYDGFFEILDLTDLTDPKIVKKVASPATGPNGVFTTGAGHYWDFDEEGIGWHTGSGGAVAFDVSDPENPKPIQATNGKGIQTPYNDFILHNSARPNAARFSKNAAPDVDKGNVLLVTEEDYVNDGNEVICEQTEGDTAGTFQTWHIPNLNGKAYRDGNPKGIPSNGTITPLDIVNAPAEFGDNAPLATPIGGFCSGHWFDYHDTGIVAQGYYQQGLWFEDVSDPENIKYYGHYTPVAAEVWDAYWVPKRNKQGLPTGEDTNIVYTADAVRGVDVLEVDLNNPAEDVGESDDDGDGNNGGKDKDKDNDTGVDDTGGGQTLPATGGGLGLLLLGAAALPVAAYIGRRRR